MNPVTSTAKQVVAPKPSRMVLASVVSGKLQKPPRVLLYGVEKIGKSTFAAAAPSPIFICAEDGTSELDVARFPEPKTWSEALEAIDILATSDHSYSTLVIDTIDWLEPLCWAHVCSKAGKSDIEAFGFGKGYIAALDEWRVMLSRLERMRDAKRMGIVMLGHSWIKPFKNPEGDDYDRHEMKVHRQSGGLIKEWCDAVLFATYETFTHEKGGRAKGISSGARIVHTERRAAWDAGNRYDLPETMPLDWEAFAEGVANHRPEIPARIAGQIHELLKKADADTAKKVSESMAKVAPNNAAELSRILNKLSAIVNNAENAQ